MRNPEIISQEIQDLEKIHQTSQELSLQFPDDEFLKMSVDQSEYRKEVLMIELEASLIHYGRHSIKYIFKDIQDKINLDFLLDNLHSFKSLLDKSYDKVTGGKHNHMPVYFNTVFSGSYGIQLSTNFEETLIDHDYEDSLSETLGFMSELTTSSEENIKEHLNHKITNDKALMSRYNNFFKKIQLTNRKVEIRWNSPFTGNKEPIIIEPKRARLLTKIFSENEVSVDTAEYIGILKGLSLISYKVEFVTDPDAKEYLTAKFDESLSEAIKSLIDRYVFAEFRVTTKYNEIKDTEEKKYQLLSLVAHQ